MALQKNAETQNYIDKKLVFGIPKSAFKLLPIVNASNKELEKMGFYPFKDETGKEVEPQYVRSKQDINGASLGYNLLQLEFYFQLTHPEIENIKGLDKTIWRMSFYIDSIDQPISSSGKYCYINKKGESQWATDEKSLVQNTYFNTLEVLRIAKRNERQFLDAIHEIAGLKNGITIDNIDKLLKGNFDEIRQLVKDINNQPNYKGFRGLLGILTSKKGTPFQDVYTKAFDYAGKEKPVKIQKQIKKDLTENYGEYVYKGFYGNAEIPTLGLYEFDQSMISTTPATYTSEPSDLPF